MGATRNTGYIENLIAYDGSDNIGIGSAVNVLYKVTIGGNTLVSGTLNVNSSVTASSFVKTGGTASQILAADGSVITAGTNITISGGTISAGDVGFANPMTTLGDIIYGAASGTATRLAGNTTTTRQFLRQTGTGSVSAAPAWDTVTKTDVGLSNVENTALSTWAGSTNIVTLGTITSGTWNGTTIAIANGGTGQTTKAAAFNALSPMTTLGDIIYGGASGAGTRLAGNTTTSKRFLIQTGDGTNSAAPSWGSIAAGDVPTLNQNTTGSAATLTTARTLTIGATGKTFDGSANVSWSLAEIGAQAALTNPVTGTGTANQIAYWNASGITGSSTFTFTPTSALLVNNSVTAASAIARGVNITSTLVAAANNDALVGVRIAPTFTNGAFTGVSNTALSVVGTSNFKDTITLEASNSTNRWDLYHYTDNTLRFNYNGAGSDEFIITTGGNATFLGTIGASNFSGSSSGTNTGDQDLSGYVTLSTAQNITGSKTFRSVFGGGTGDFTDITTPIIKISPTTGFWRIPFISNDENISGVFNFQTGKNVYWGEVDDTGTYFFRGRGINVQSLTGTSAVFSGDVTSNGNIRINTDTNPTSLTGKQLVLRADSANGGQSLIAMQGYDKTTRWVLNVQTAANTYDYTLYSNTVTIGTAPSYNPKFALTQAGVLRLHNYTTNGFVKFSGGDGTLSVDTNTYLTTTDASNTYLPLTGGALSSSTTTGILSIRSTSASGYSSINFLNNSGTQTGSIGWGNATVPDVIGRNSLYIYSASEGISFLTDSEGISRKMYLNNAGNLGLGITPSAWSLFTALQLGGNTYAAVASSNTYLQLSTNVYYDGTNFKYITTGVSTRYQQSSGGHYWYSAASGSAGTTATHTQYLVLDSSGNLGLGNGVSPASWANGTEGALQIKNGGVYGYSDYEVGLTANAYYNTGWKRIAANTASMIYVAGGIELKVAASSTANSSITWTTPISVANTGEVSFTSIAPSWSYSAPSTTYKNIDWGGGGVLYRNDSDSYLTANCYYSTTGWKAKYTSAQGVGIWRMLGGDVAWHTYDGSVTAGSVYTLSDKFFISKSGNVGIGEAVDTFPSGDSLLIKNSGTWNVSIGLQNTGTGGRKWNIFSTNDTFGQGGGKFLIYNSTGSSDALIIDSSNNAVFGGNVTATSALKLARSTNNWELYHYTDNTLRFNYNGAGNDEFAIDTTGNAYIRSYLTVGTPTFHTYGILNVWRTVSGTSWGAIADYTNGTDMNLRINISDVGATTKYVELGSYTTNPLVFNYNQGGNVGINHNAPSHKLTVRNGDIAIANHNQASGDFSQAQALHFLNEGVTPLATIKAVRVNWAQGRTDLTFSTYDSGMSEKVRIAYNGAVGIGTTNLTGLTGSCVYIRATSSNVGQTAIAIQDYTGANRWAINGQDGASNYSFNIYSAPTGTNDFTRRLRIGQDGVFSFNSTDTTYTYNFIGGSMYIPGGQSAASTAAYTAWNQLVFGDQYSNVARGPNKIVTYGRGGSWVAGIGVHDDTQAYYAGGTHKFYKFDGTTATLNLSLDGSGNLTATGGFFEGSDMRIKELIQENYQVSGIDAIKPKLYTKHGKTEIGYYAQDFEEIMPHALSVGEDGYLSLSYREVHTAKIASLEARVKELEEQLKQK